MSFATKTVTVSNVYIRSLLPYVTKSLVHANMNEYTRKTILLSNVGIDGGYYTRDFNIKSQGLTSTSRAGILLKVSHDEQ